MTADCRELKLSQEFDAVICLYDIVGTYAEDSENVKILQTLYAHLKSGAKALISVMNGTLTKKKAIQWFTLDQEPDKLLALSASQTMEKTGDIFDPQYYMIEKHSGIVFRKEQFASGNALPAE